jgi:two-component system, NarL family, response regulator NreC
MKIIKIVIADDHAILREGLGLLIKSQHDMEVVSEASDGIEALDAVRTYRPDLMLLDIAMPKINGLDAVRLILQAVPNTKVIILSRYEKEAYVHQALNAGAMGYVVKGAASSDLLEAIRTVDKGKFYLSAPVQASVIESYLHNSQEKPQDNEDYEQLSEREKQVFHLLIQGNSSTKIGDILCISSKTVDKHRANISKKIGTENPIEMVQYAARIGVLDPSFWGE